MVRATTLEKVMLVGLLSVIFSQTLPGHERRNLELFVGHRRLRRGERRAGARRGPARPWSSSRWRLSFAVRMAVNAGLVLVGVAAAGPGDLNVSAALFYVMLLSLLTTLHDRWLPVHSVRARSTPAPT